MLIELEEEESERQIDEIKGSIKPYIGKVGDHFGLPGLCRSSIFLKSELIKVSLRLSCINPSYGARLLLVFYFHAYIFGVALLVEK